MKIPFVDLTAQYNSIATQIDGAISAVIQESAFIRGKYVRDFEISFARSAGVNHCVSCGNGTDALYIAMKGLGIQEGDEVITTAHSWISTSETITQAGGSVVFCDTDDTTFTIDPNKIEEKITPRTVGIIPVHLFGQSSDMGLISNIAQKYNLWVLEDCAQAHLATFDGLPVGSFGNAGTFSFYPGKNLGAYGDGGCIVTNDDELAKWCRKFADHGGKSDHSMEGINSRLDGLQAAILSAKLPYLVEWTKSRNDVADKYNTGLVDLPQVETPQVGLARNHSYHLYVIRAERRDELKEHLLKKGIETSCNYPRALPFYPAYDRLGHVPADFPVAYQNQGRILSLPMYPELTNQQIGYVVEAIKEFYEL